MAYWRLHYHLVWSTFQREPMLTKAAEKQVYGTILSKAKALGILVHAIGGIEDHIHLVVSVPPRYSIAECVQHFKGASSHYVNHQPGASGSFHWQDDYGAMTIGERSLVDVTAYVLSQKEHHLNKTVRPLFEPGAEQSPVQLAQPTNAPICEPPVDEA
jgi:putative transposase